jgi:flagellum-specific peptidoglycan hydrolase FlgJ
MKGTKIISILFLTILLASCGGSRKTSQQSKQKPKSTAKIVINQGKIEDKSKVSTPKITQIEFTNTETYILYFKDVAIQKMKEFNIPASITLAQGVLESNSGKSELAFKSNNHFGIKCHEWTGERVYHDDDEKGECFRKYPDPKQSYEDHSLFLTSRSRYAPLFKLKKSDYKAWARGLKNAGYATDKKYPDKLITIIEKYRLDRYDREALGKDYEEAEEEVIVAVNQEVDTTDNRETQTGGSHIVRQGETLYAISKLYGLDVETLKTWNNLSSNEISIGQVLKVSADSNNTLAQSVQTRYIVQQGDTLYAISRKTGIAVEEIKLINNLNSNELKIGQELILKK